MMLGMYQNTHKMVNDFKQYFLVLVSVIFVYDNNINDIFSLGEVFLDGNSVVPVTR